MITLTSKYKELEAQFQALQVEHNKIKEEKASADAQIAELTKEPVSVVALEQAVKDLDTANVKVQELTTANTTLTTEVNTLKSEKHNLEEMAAAKALEISNSQGVPPLSLKPEAQPSSVLPQGDVFAQFQALKSASAQRAFWEKNKEAITALLDKK